MAVADLVSTMGITGIDRDDYRPVALERLALNHTLRFSLHSDEGLLLLAQGNLLTPRALDALAQRGFNTVLAHRREPAAPIQLGARGSALEILPPRATPRLDFFNRSSRRLDMLLLEKIAAALQSADPPMLAEVQPHGVEPYDDSLTRELFETHEEFVDELLSAFTGKREAIGGAASSAVQEYLALVLRDIDLFTCMAGAPERGSYPQRHSLHVAMLSMAMGIRAGLGKADLQALGMGSMLHDMGMLRVPKPIWMKKGPLAIPEMHELMKHPLYTLESLEELPEIPDEARLVCYQMHERPWSQGYPRGLPGDKIHPLAKIAAAADMYVALISDRPYRPAVLPYKALEAIIKQVKDRRIEPMTARLLVETLSLYPIGSYVQLSDGRVAKVARATGATYDRPIVRVWPQRVDPKDGGGEMLDLREHPDLQVNSALPPPE